MSQVIENKVVSMEFDNKNFQRGVGETLSLLGKLQQALNLTKSAKSMYELGDASKKLDFSKLQNLDLTPVVSGIETLTDRFSTLGIIGMTVIQRLTNGVIDFVTNGINRAVSGGMRRALNIEKAEFTLKGLDADVARVRENALAAVRGTAFGLDEAFKAASMFTASGIKAGKDMEEALTGISGVAAMTSSSYSEIANVFTNVAGTGYMMGDALLSLATRGLNGAAAMAKYYEVVKGIKYTEEEIRDMAGKRQISAEDFFKAMNYLYGEQAKKANDTYEGALSNVQAALSRIGAAFMTPYIKNMREVFVGLIDVLDDVGNLLKPVVSFYEKSFTKLKDGTVGALKSVDTFLKALVKIDEEGNFTGWNLDVFGVFKYDVKSLAIAISHLVTRIRMLGSDLIKKLTPSMETVTKVTHTLLGGLTRIISFVGDFILAFDSLAFGTGVVGKDIFTRLFGEQNANNLIDALKGIASFVRILSNAFKALFKAVKPVSGIFKPLASVIVSMAGAIGRYITKLEELINRHEVLQRVTSVLKKVMETFRDVITYISEGVSNLFSNIGKGKALDSIASAWENNAERLEKAKTLLYTVLDAIGNGVKGIVKGLSEAFKTGDFEPMLDLVNGGVLAAIGIAIKNFIDTMASGAEKMGAANVKEGLLGTLTSLQGTLEGFQNSLKANVLIKIAIAVGILAASLVMLAAVDPQRLTAALAAISTVMFALFKEMDALSTLLEGKDPKKTFNFVKLGLAIDLMAVGVLILASAVKKLAGLDLGGIVKGLIGIFGIMVAMAIGLDQISMVENADKIVTKAFAIVVLATAIRILATAVEAMGKLNPLDLTKGLLGVIGLLMAVVYLLDTFDPTMSLKTGLGILAISAAIRVLAESVTYFGEMDTAKLGQGLEAVGILLGMVAGLGYALGKTDNIMKSAIAIGILALAMQPLVHAIKILGDAEPGAVAKGLIAMSVGLIAMTAAMAELKGTELTGAAGIAVISVALLVFAKAMQEIVGMDPAQILWALASLATGLVLMVGAMNIAEGSIVGAAAIVLIATALKIFAGAMKAIGKLKVSEIVKSLLTIAVAFVEIAAASILFTVLAVPLAIMSAVLLALSIALLAAGVGVSAFAGGLKLLGEIGASGVDGIVETLKGLSEALPTIFENLALAVVGTLEVFYENVPKFVELGIAMILALLQGIEQNIGQIVGLVGSIVAQFLEGLAASAQQIIDGVFDLLVSVLNGLATAIYTKSDAIVSAIDRIIGAIVYFVLTALQKLLGHIPVVGDMIDEALEGVKGDIEDEFDLNEAESTGKSMGETTGYAYVEALRNAGMNEEADALLAEIEGTVESHYSPMKEKAKSIVEGAKDGMEEVEFTDTGENIMKGLADGMEAWREIVRQKAISIVKGSKESAESYLQIKSPSRVFMRIGEYVGEGFAIGIESMSDRVSGASEGIADGAISAASSLTRRLASRMESADFQPTIRPVLDLSNVEEGAGAVNGLFGGMSIGASIDKVEALNASIDTNQNGSNLVTDMMNQMLYKMNDMQKAFSNGAVDPNLVYEAVYAGSSQATPNIRLNNRELNRELRSMGVAYR